MILLEYQNIKTVSLKEIQTDLKKCLWLKKLNAIPWTYVTSDLNGEEIVGSFYEKELQKANQEELRNEKVIRRKRDKLHFQWKGYDNSFNSWIDEKGTVKKESIVS